MVAAAIAVVYDIGDFPVYWHSLIQNIFSVHTKLGDVVNVSGFHGMVTGFHGMISMFALAVEVLKIIA